MQSLTRYLIAFCLFLSCMPVAKAETLTQNIVDARNITVKLPTKISRIVTMDPFSTQLVLVLQKQNQLVAGSVGINIGRHDVIDSLFLQAKKWDSIFAGANPNIEEIVKLKPDVVFAQRDRNNYKKIEELGIPVITFALETPTDLLNGLLQAGQILGASTRAEKLKDSFLKRVNEIKSAIPKKDAPKHIYVAGATIVSTFGGSAWQTQMINMVGGKSVSEKLVPIKANVGIEDLLAWNPEVIILSAYCAASVEEVLKDKRLQGVKAIVAKQVYQIPRYILSWELPTPESLLGVYWLADKLHQGKISINLSKVIPEIYNEFYTYKIPAFEIGKLLK